MPWLIFKKASWNTLFLTSVFFCIVIIYMNRILNNGTDGLYWADNVPDYINNGQGKDCIEKLEYDVQEAGNKVSEIESLVGRSELSVEDSLAMFLGQYTYSSKDIAWIQNELNKPGIYTNHVAEDYYFLLGIYRDYNNQKLLSDIKENNINFMHRNIKKSQPNEYSHKKYEKCLASYKKLNTKTFNSWTRSLNLLQDYILHDQTLLFAILLISFSIFSNLNQNGTMRMLLTTKKSAGDFCIKCFLAYAIWVSIVYLLYWLVCISMVSRYYLKSSIWKEPMQVLNSMENSVLNITVGQYMFLLGVYLFLYIITLYCIFSIVSLCCKTNVKSAIFSLIVALAFVFVKSSLPKTFSDSMWLAYLLSGRFDLMAGNASYINFLGFPIHSLIITGCLMLIFITATMVVLKRFSKNIVIKM